MNLNQETIDLVLQNKTLIALLLLWVLPWKGVALWKSARLGDTAWFVVMLVANTMGIMEILYIFLISKRKGLKGK